MPPLIVLHAGFHKTGTTTVQKTLRAHYDLLAPDLAVVLVEDIRSLCMAARRFSFLGDPADLTLMTGELDTLAETMADIDTPVLISAEDLAGVIPGRGDCTGYNAAPRLMRTIVDRFAALLPGTPITIAFVTRDPLAWLKSCYAQHLRHDRMRLSQADYVTAFTESANLGAVAEAVAAAVPEARVVRIAMEDCEHRRLGVLDRLLDLAGYTRDRDAIHLAPRANVSPPQALLDDLLALNRSDLSDADADRRRRAINRDLR